MLKAEVDESLWKHLAGAELMIVQGLEKMSKLEKLLSQVVDGRVDANIAFADLCRLLRRLGFSERTRGSHHIFSRPDIEERLNLQESGAKAKPYQVRQVRAVIIKYGLEV